MWLVIGLLGTVLFNRSSEFGALGPNLRDAAAALFQVANIHYGLCTSGHDICAAGGVPFGTYWSLSLEEQFYMVFPFVLAFIPRLLLAPALAIAAAVQIFSVRSGMSWELRSDAFILGALLTLWQHRGIPRFLEPTVLRRPRILTASFILFYVGLCMAPAQSLVYFTSGVVALLCALWVFVASFDAGYVLPRFFPRSVMLWMGSRSYAIYLCHFPAWCASVEIFYRHGTMRHIPVTIQYIVLGGSMLCASAELTYRVVEIPLRNHGRKIADRVEQRLLQARDESERLRSDIVEREARELS